MTLELQATATPEDLPRARVVPRWRIRSIQAVVIVLALMVGIAAWRELEPLLIFRKVDAVCVWAERRPATVKMRRENGYRRRSGFVPEVAYRYQVNGVEHLSSIFSRMPMVESARQVGRRMNGVSTGVKITAWYNPFHPSDSVIDRSPNPIWLGIVVVGGLFCRILWWMTRVMERSDRAAGRAAGLPG